MPTLDELRATVSNLRREVYAAPRQRADELFAELVAAEAALAAEQRKVQGDGPGASAGLLFTNSINTDTLSADTTGLEVKCHLRMAQVPTAIAHLLDGGTDPLLSCSVQNSDVANKIRRVRVSSYVEGYSAQAIDTFEIKPNKTHTFDQLPTFFPERLDTLHELTRATLHISVDDLDGKMELQRTQRIWLLPRTTAPLAVKDPTTSVWRDLTRYLGAFVTPNAPAIESLLRAAVDLAPEAQFVSYQGGPAAVTPQIKALFNALQQKKLRYVNSVLAFSPDDGWSGQRVRLPRLTLESANANCLDGTVLFASLIEAISLRAAIILIPGHAFVGWQNDPADPEAWSYLETTLVAASPFEEAMTVATQRAAAFVAAAVNAPELFRRWALNDLRTQHGILPME
jgi:hypothetical protein